MQLKVHKVSWDADIKHAHNERASSLGYILTPDLDQDFASGVIRDVFN